MDTGSSKKIIIYNTKLPRKYTQFQGNANSSKISASPYTQKVVSVNRFHFIVLKSKQYHDNTGRQAKHAHNIILSPAQFEHLLNILYSLSPDKILQH
jgi:hypothetical protein